MAAAVPMLRAWNIALRTLHIGAMGILLGGHFFDVPADRLLRLLYVTILTGTVLGIVEIYPDWRGLFEVRSLLIGAKLALLCLVPWLWEYRVGILLIVLAMASAGSHMPRRFRHYSVLQHQPTGAISENPSVTSR